MHVPAVTAFLDFVAEDLLYAMWHRIAFRGLRHGAATLMLAAGVYVKVVSDALGHSDTRITRDIYQSVLPQVGKSAAEATAKLVPLRRKSEAEQARKAAKQTKEVQAKAKKKAKRKKPRT